MFTKEMSLRGRRKLFLIGLSFLLCVSFVNSTDFRTIKENSNFCKKDNRSIIECDLNNRPGKFEESKWSTNVNGYEIKNTTPLIIERQCQASNKEILLRNCRNIKTKEIVELTDCKVRLRLEECEGGVLKDLFNLINIKESTLDAISLVVDQFDIRAGSEIGNLDIKSTGKQSTVIGSEVDVVTRMEVEGSHKLEITNSVIGEVQKFVYNSSYKDSTIMNTTFGSLAGEGSFSVVQGSLTIENVIFKSLQSHSIILSGGKTSLIDVNIAEGNAQSLVLRGTDTVVEFVNVSVGDGFPLSLTITSQSDSEVFPLAFRPFGFQVKPEFSGAIGVLVGLLFGMALMALFFFYCRRCRSLFTRGKGKENVQLPLTSVSAHAEGTKPQPPTPLVNHPTQISSEPQQTDCNEDYYSDVQTQSPNFPPLPTTIPPSLVEGDKLPQVAKQGNIPSSDIQPKKHEGNFEEEEPIYDECENYQSPSPPPPMMIQAQQERPPTDFRKPIVPKKFQLPSNSDGRDDPAIDPPNGQQTPLITNKSVGNKPSFLHAVSKPPPPPRVTTKGVVTPSSKPAPKIPKHLFEQRGGHLPNPPQLEKNQAGFPGNAGHDDDIYEPVPDF